jgi:phosphoglycolate phosphatase
MTASEKIARRAKAILFDKDGTLFDFEASYAPATAAVLRELAGDERRAFDMGQAIGFDLNAGRFLSGSAVIAGTAHDLAQALAPYADIGAGQHNLFSQRIDMLFARHSTGAMALFPETPQVLQAISAAGLPIGLATNDSEENGRAHLAAAGIGHHFDFFAGHDSGHGAKPGPGMVLAFARQCGVAPSDVVMVGDSAHDMVCAKGAGATGVAIASGMTPADELAIHADHVVGRLEEILALPGISLC